MTSSRLAAMPARIAKALAQPAWQFCESLRICCKRAGDPVLRVPAGGCFGTAL